jgi:hypothetical protein
MTGRIENQASLSVGQGSGYGTTKGCGERWPRGPLTVRQPRIRDNPSRRGAVTVSSGRYRAGRHLTAASKAACQAMRKRSSGAAGRPCSLPQEAARIRPDILERHVTRADKICKAKRLQLAALSAPSHERDHVSCSARSSYGDAVTAAGLRERILSTRIVGRSGIWFA